MKNPYSRFDPETVIDLTPDYKGDGGPPGGPPVDDEIVSRVKTLEDDMKKLLQDTAEIKGMLRSAPSAVDFGELKGRVNGLPSTAKAASLLAIAVAAMTIVMRWHELLALFQAK